MVRVATLPMGRESLQITWGKYRPSEAIYARAVSGYDCQSGEIQPYGGAVHATFDTQCLNVVPPEEGTMGAEYREFSVDVRRSEAVTLRQPVMPVFDSFAG
jgi:hypothetical protein